MKFILILLITFFFSTVYAQDMMSKSQKDSSVSVKLMPFQKKYLSGAIILETFIPTMGYVYARNWKKGIIPATLRISGMILAAYQIELGHLNGIVEIKNKFLFTSGLIIWLSGLTWSYIGLKGVIDDYNNSLMITILPPANNLKTFTLSMSFSL